jgi:thiaminase (transcriptional activator TenA)
MVSDVLRIMLRERSTGVSSLLQESGRQQWSAALAHPMVLEIGNGSLPHAKFRRYFEQNLLYLQDYARAIALIVGKAATRESLTTLSRFLVQIVEHEIPANADFLTRLGGDVTDLDGSTSMHPVTYAYTRHLLYVAGQDGFAEGLTAVLPCQWSYGELAKQFVHEPPDDPIYADWIAMFGNDDYDRLVESTTSLLDAVVNVEDPEQVGKLAAIFDRSTDYEVRFWDMAYGTARAD